MQIEERKIFGLKTLSIVLDDDLAREAVQDRKHSRITVLSHERLDLPGFRLRTEGLTGYIELTKGYEEILSSFNEDTRKKIRRTFRSDFPVSFIVSAHVTKEAYKTYAEFTRHEDLKRRNPYRKPFPIDYFKECWEVAAVKDGEVISAVWVFNGSPTSRLSQIFSMRHRVGDSDMIKVISQSGRRVIFEACKEAIKRGSTALDFGKLPERSEVGGGFKNAFNPNVIHEYYYARTSVTYYLFETLMGLWRGFQRGIRKLRFMIVSSPITRILTNHYYETENSNNKA